MKVLIPTTDEEPTMDSKVSDHFGEAKSFLVVDLVTGELETIPPPEDEFQECPDCELILSLGVQAVVCNMMRESNLRTVCDHDVDVWVTDSTKVRDAVQTFKLGGSFVKRPKGA